MNVHVGGGRSLLQALLLSLPAELHVIALLDARMQIPDNLPTNLEIRKVQPSLKNVWRQSGGWLAKYSRAMWFCVSAICLRCSDYEDWQLCLCKTAIWLIGRVCKVSRSRRDCDC